jgi:hypothetical protein
MDGNMWRWVMEDDVLQQNPNPVPWLSFFSGTLICGPHRSSSSDTGVVRGARILGPAQAGCHGGGGSAG